MSKMIWPGGRKSDSALLTAEKRLT